MAMVSLEDVITHNLFKGASDELKNKYLSGPARLTLNPPKIYKEKLLHPKYIKIHDNIFDRATKKLSNLHHDADSILYSNSLTGRFTEVVKELGELSDPEWHFNVSLVRGNVYVTCDGGLVQVTFRGPIQDFTAYFERNGLVVDLSKIQEPSYLKGKA